ncbi:heme peroxidase family protein [Mycolicibacterium chubuense NBB4]|uniref:Heme peroxidase family protein n=1 Tax=Mycolicibacterium chubuense (strain NBB4) TaxID=710421 RepID=I4BJT8_MYCCN|nr:peroxidase family protein [Mycolicibacterium chubuense]AFM17545.1 heme peroxidase family protein [Mycolicibacterium chubuense NBB4]
MTGGFWRRNGVKNGVRIYATTHFEWFWRTLARTPKVRSRVNKWIINRSIYTMATRPAPLSTRSDYTSWESLHDRAYSLRHLPANPALQIGQPPVDRVAELFRRPTPRSAPSDRSTLLFPLFAQWFVDGFLRTDPTCPLKNTSTHDIDLSQLYGQTEDVTSMLREGSGGRLLSQVIDGQEFPPYYFGADGRVDPRFEGLQIAYPGNDRKTLALGDIPVEKRQKLFALGIPRGNIHYGFVMMSTLFLREHNRLAALIRANHPTWDDDRIFDTTRNTLIVMLIKVVIEDYINHITPIKFPLFVEPGIGLYEKWYRQNWMSVEFNLLYRWHSLVPTEVRVGGRDVMFSDVGWDTRIVTDHGLAALFHEASDQPCSTISLLNTDASLLDIEKTSIAIGRDAELDSYNAYRQRCGFPRLHSFRALTSDRTLRKALADCYGKRGIDDLELFVGLFGEDVGKGATLPTLMTAMVAVDAFSQALTNPLLAPGIYGKDTFSYAGLDEIDGTRTLQDIVRRNVPGEEFVPRVSLGVKN